MNSADDPKQPQRPGRWPLIILTIAWVAGVILMLPMLISLFTQGPYYRHFSSYFLFVFSTIIIVALWVKHRKP